MKLYRSRMYHVPTEGLRRTVSLGNGGLRQTTQG